MTDLFKSTEIKQHQNPEGALIYFLFYHVTALHDISLLQSSHICIVGVYNIAKTSLIIVEYKVILKLIL